MRSKKQAPGYFSISVVADTYGIHPQTLRLYEREGLLSPSRTEGNTRLYSQTDIDQLEAILNLTRDLGVNLAGVEIILNMRTQMEKMQTDINEMLSAFRQVMVEKMEDGEKIYKNSLVRVHAQSSLIRIPEEK